MTHFDLPLPALREHRPPLSVPDDFDGFWQRTLEQARRLPRDVRRRPVDAHLSTVEVHDLVFAGSGGAPVAAWLVLPAHRPAEPLPCVVEYIGYGSGRGLPHERLTWASAGCATLVMDTRGQGSGPSIGVTADPDGTAGPSVPGFLTRGAQSPEAHYYRRVFTDAVLAVDVARSLPEVDPARVVAAGGSQGGGIALAVAGLVPDLFAVMSDVPFLCSFRRATEITDAEPYAELVRWCAAHRDRVDELFRTLDHVDAVHHASRATAPLLMSVALRDAVCPPSTVFAAYNHYAGQDKQIRVWEYNGHEGGGQHQVGEQLRWLGERLAG